jgi:hypothetical protein
MFGHPDPNVLYPWALAVRRPIWPAVAKALHEVDTLWDVILWASSIEWVDRLRLLVLPATDPASCCEVASAPDLATSWLPRSGILPPPRYLPVASSPPVQPPPVPYYPLRNGTPRFGDGGSAATIAPSAMDWARFHRWKDRWRLALPWRYGLLERGMKGRW